ncbi:MAG: VOC family protein [Myxococcota bacterium]
MQRVLGVGGVFFRAKGDRKALLEWYRTHLGIEFEEWGGRVFLTAEEPGNGLTWSIFESETTYFGPGNAFMVNYKVADLDAMLVQLRDAGVEVDDHVERSEYGHFGWCKDPEGNRIELWQAPDE